MSAAGKGKMLSRRPTGFAAFTVIWLGQIVSVLGTRMTNFALSIWLWKVTGHATSLGVMIFLSFGATVALSPLAGSLVDRFSRRIMIVISDVGSAVTTAVIFILFLAGIARPWELYVVNTLTGAFLAFQYPAYSATITQMMPKAHYARANSMLSLANSVPAIFAPALAATLLGFLPVSAILGIDVISYAVGVVMVFLVAIPERADSGVEEKAPRGRVWRDTVIGFQYITRRRGLLGLEGILFVVSLLAAMGWILLIPMIMARTGNSEAQVGVVLSIGAIGGVLGGALVTVRRAPANKMRWVLIGTLGFNLIGRFLLGISDSVILWSVGWFTAWLCIPFIDGYGQAIFQQKVEPAVQGRVFAARQMLENLAMPIAVGVAAPIADYYLEPRMMHGGSLAPVFGGLVGAGPGAGMALVFVFTGLIGTVVGIAAICSRSVRDLEQIIPDQERDTVPINV
jgi:DHA3 family macrolide efflux protein-like MFS transporter